jgi:hypothetical protein
MKIKVTKPNEAKIIFDTLVTSCLCGNVFLTRRKKQDTENPKVNPIYPIPGADYLKMYSPFLFTLTGCNSFVISKS